MWTFSAAVINVGVMPDIRGIMHTGALQARNQGGFGGFVRTPLFANPLQKIRTPPPTLIYRSNRLNFPKNRKTHCCWRYCAAANHITFIRMLHGAASRSVLDDHVDIIHANMTWEEVQDFVCAPDQKLNPAIHHFRPSSNLLRSCKRPFQIQHLKGLQKYP